MAHGGRVTMTLYKCDVYDAYMRQLNREMKHEGGMECHVLYRTKCISLEVEHEVGAILFNFLLSLYQKEN